ncbi:MAG TPA: response regulator [Stellaceae bacterium]|nr:response regulator [Stellaceae bacterium]
MPRILIIDDDQAVRFTIQAILQREGYEVVCASDGDQGLRALERVNPHLIITDIIMPNKEGLATIMEIRAHDTKTPIIAMSGGGRTGNMDFLKMAETIGANEVLPKPFERDHLTAAVRRLLAD